MFDRMRCEVRLLQLPKPVEAAAAVEDFFTHNLTRHLGAEKRVSARPDILLRFIASHMIGFMSVSAFYANYLPVLSNLLPRPRIEPEVPR